MFTFIAQREQIMLAFRQLLFYLNAKALRQKAAKVSILRVLVT